MTTRPERQTPVQVPIYRLCELPEGTKIRWGNGTEETIWQPRSAAAARASQEREADRQESFA